MRKVTVNIQLVCTVENADTCISNAVSNFLKRLSERDEMSGVNDVEFNFIHVNESGYNSELYTDTGAVKLSPQDELVFGKINATFAVERDDGIIQD